MVFHFWSKLPTLQCGLSVIAEILVYHCYNIRQLWYVVRKVWRVSSPSETQHCYFPLRCSSSAQCSASPTLLVCACEASLLVRDVCTCLGSLLLPRASFQLVKGVSRDPPLTLIAVLQSFLSSIQCSIFYLACSCSKMI